VLTLIFMWICNSNGLLNNFLAFNAYLQLVRVIQLLHLKRLCYEYLVNRPLFMVIYLAAMQDIRKVFTKQQRLMEPIGGISSFVLRYHFYSLIFFLLWALLVHFSYSINLIFSRGTGGPNNSTLTVVLNLSICF